ncbi:MAG: AAA family ATPase [Actinobacteria bacterium]|uniref:Unannotated protein n=1 Tax=freshwater metagenome TaxID=449393 RepID=A0A6J6WMK1_9ZZZZ|nr:AAA family ATPase [Actinomycetota bacterium]
MNLPLILADQRLAERRGIKAVIFGKSGIGKTSLLWTLEPDQTLFFDLEAGDLAIEGWTGDTIRPRTWEECRDFAVFIGGPNPAVPDGRPYSKRHYAEACAKYGDPKVPSQPSSGSSRRCWCGLFPIRRWPEHDLAGGRRGHGCASRPRGRGNPRGAAALLLDRVRGTAG